LSPPRCLGSLEEANQNPFEFLERHQAEIGASSAKTIKGNEFSVKNGFRILSAYRTLHDVKVWIITEADRSVTTLLLPHEY
jgi:hypothetical protein